VSHVAAAALGAIAGATIFIGLPIGRVRGVSRALQGFLNAVATGVLIFLLWDILTHAVSPVETALAAFAHEVRTPLTGILAISNLLATSELDERERRWVDTIKAGAEHLASLATLFVDAARSGGLKF